MSENERARIINPMGSKPQRNGIMIVRRENEIGRIIVDVAFKIHTTRGPGLPESVYQSASFYDLSKGGLKVA